MNSDVQAKWWAVLQQFPVIAEEIGFDDVTLTEQQGGFSQARVWQVTTHGQAWCLRYSPPSRSEPARTRALHAWLRELHAAGLPVAVPLPSALGGTTYHTLDGCWQLEPWLPGLPDRDDEPGLSRVRNAARMLASIHRHSASHRCDAAARPWFSVSSGPSETARERYKLLSRWTREMLLSLSHRQSRQNTGAMSEVASEFLSHAVLLIPTTLQQLREVANLTVPLIPCWRDLWRDHVLFTGDDVTGVIDPTVAWSESVACDLSRFLGTYLGNDLQRWEVALREYESVRRLTVEEQTLIPVYDRSNLLLSGLTWINHVAENPSAGNDERILERLSRFLSRLESISTESQTDLLRSSSITRWF